jgi:hypothetical protein
MEGCTKDKYMVLNPLTTRSKKDIISLLSSYNTLPYFYLNIDRILDINYIFWTLQQLSSRNLPVYITTSISLPDSILEELSKNPYNVVQFNIGEVSDDSSDYEDTELFLKHKNLKKCMYRSKTYGLYVVLRIEPVIPGITRVSRLISLIASVKNSCNHITVSFVRIWRSDDEGATYLKYRGEILDKKHFELNNDIWDCSEEYKDKVMSQLKLFSQGNSLSACRDSQCKYCRGMRLKSSTRDGDMFILNTRGYFERKEKRNKEE